MKTNLPARALLHYNRHNDKATCQQCRAIKVLVIADNKAAQAQAGIPWGPYGCGTNNYHALCKWRMDWWWYLINLYNKYYPDT